MAQSRPASIVRRTGFAAAPGIAVVIILMVAGVLPINIGILSLAAVLVLSGVLFWQHIRDLDRLQQRIDHIREHAQDIKLPTPSHPNLSSSVSRLASSWLKRAQDLESHSHLANAILEGLPDPIILVDAKRHVIRTNPATDQLTDKSLVGANLATGLRHPTLLDGVERVLSTRDGESVEITLPVPIERTFSARIEPILDVDENPAALIMLHDLTAIRAGERMRVDFIANVSHELRTPLSSLLGFIETLRGPARDDQDATDRFLAIMHDQSERMARLIEDLLSLSKIEMDEHTLPRDMISLPAILANVEDMLTMKAREKDMSIEIDLDEGLQPVVGDKDQLTQVFQNLVDNALKYGREKTAVTVTGRAGPKGRISVAIKDCGEGIPPEHLPRLTERFYRVDAARSRDLGGTGLGLAIVKHIVSRHRGTLAIESELGVGSSFVVTLRTAEQP